MLQYVKKKGKDLSICYYYLEDRVIQIDSRYLEMTSQTFVIANHNR